MRNQKPKQQSSTSASPSHTKQNNRTKTQENTYVKSFKKAKKFSPIQLQQRQASVPPISYPAQLPVFARKTEIAQAITENQVVIIAGETGSGKTTQIPKICLELGRGINGLIGHTQPRRIAARSVAERICSELQVPLGAQIGYQVRFTDMVSPQTLVKLMTDGILLAEIKHDPLLLRYDTIIIDEAHERSLNIDFLLGYLAQLLPKRPDLKLIITSATIDAQRFATHFGKHMYGGYEGNTAPIIEVSGRTYPVEIRYRPLYLTDKENTSEEENLPELATQTPTLKDQVTGIIEAVEELTTDGEGDILVFLSGEGEIKETQQALQDYLQQRYISPGGSSKTPGAIEVLPLFARLSASEQHRIFHPGKYRRIILATNIAETSLTVPRIKYVIDPGLARISRFSNKTKVQRLPIEEISQASANQRAGRCGRIAEGITIRLYSETDFYNRPEFTEPEIQRTSLAAVILQMTALNLGEVKDFPFLDLPDLRAVKSGLQLLVEIGAITLINGKAKLTPIGKQLAQLPIDPRLGRMLLAAQEHNCIGEVLVLVAAMSLQDVRERPTEYKTQSDTLHARFTDPNSDFLAYLHLWRYLHTQQRELSNSAFRRLCKAEYLHWLRFRQWQDLVLQLRQFLQSLGISARKLGLPDTKELTEIAQTELPDIANSAIVMAVKNFATQGTTADADAIHKSLLVGMLSNLGNWDERKRDYLGARNTHFVIWPGSGLYRKTPSWVMAAELVETSRLFARTVAKINPEWIETAANHLIKKQYSEPFWSTRHGAALSTEKVTLYGLTVIADRQVLLAKAGTENAKELARELFIRHALVENQWRSFHEFVKDNKQAVAKASEIENKLRQYGLVASLEDRFAFFAQRIPAHIVSAKHFDSWWKKEKRKNPRLLHYTDEFLLGENQVDPQNFPAVWTQGEFDLPIKYHFQPGRYSDGLTIDVPITVLPQLQDQGFDWLVPGLLPELILTTIKCLPKNVRKHLVPAPDTANLLLPKLLKIKAETALSGELNFSQAFTKAVRELRGIEIPAQTWADFTLPPHLQITFQVRSERDAVLDVDTSLTALQRKLAPATQSAVEKVVKNAVAQAVESARLELLTTSSQLTASNSTDPLQILQQGLLTEMVESTASNGMIVRGYPAFVAQNAWRGELTIPSNIFTDANNLCTPKVSLRILTDPALQAKEHRFGILYLLLAELSLPTARVTSRWNSLESLLLGASPYASTADLVQHLQFAAITNMATKWSKQEKQKLGTLRTYALYQNLRDYVRNTMEDEIYRIARIVARILGQYTEVVAQLKQTTSSALINTVEDVKEQLNKLIYPGFIIATPDTFLADLPRFLQGIGWRLSKAEQNVEQDFLNSQVVQETWDLLIQAQNSFVLETFEQQTANKLVEARWLLEELRISLFAQQLGTRVKVSPQRIRKLLTT